MITFLFYKRQPRFTSCLHLIGTARSFCTRVCWRRHVSSLSFSLRHGGSFGVYDPNPGQLLPFSSFLSSFLPFCRPPIKAIPLWADMRSNKWSSSPPPLICILLGVFASVLRKLFCLSYTYRADTQREGRAWADRRERNP